MCRRVRANSTAIIICRHLDHLQSFIVYLHCFLLWFLKVVYVHCRYQAAFWQNAVAGLTVAMTLLPESMALALFAGNA